MSGDKIPNDSGSTHRSRGGKPTKSLLTEDYDPLPTPSSDFAAGAPSQGRAAQGNAAEEQDPTSFAQEPAPVESRKRKRLSPNQLRRKRRAQKLLLATILTGVFVTLVMWSRNRPGNLGADVQVPAIAPAILFEQRCEQVREAQSDILHVTEFAVDDSMVQAMVGIDSLETVIFDQGAVTDQAIEAIASLPKLQHLRLRLSPIGDEGLKRIASIESLWYLNLPHAECTSQGVAQLAALPRLRQLRLGSTKLGNEVAREIAKIGSLRGIHLIGIPVTDEGLKTLGAMPHLESLYLDDCAVTEAGWDWLFREYPHLHVHVNQSHHDRDPKSHPHH